MPRSQREWRSAAAKPVQYGCCHHRELSAPRPVAQCRAHPTGRPGQGTAPPARCNHHIVQANLPVLCIDTCSLLDIFRDPLRETSQPHNAVAAKALLQAVKSGPSPIELLAAQVSVEFNDHLNPVTGEAKKGLQKLRTHVGRVGGLVSAFGTSVSTDLLPWDNHVTNAVSVAHQWIQASALAAQLKMPKIKHLPVR